MTMQLITNLCSTEVLKNPKLTTTDKIEMIKTKFVQHPHIRFDETTGRYRIKPDDYSEKYLEITGGLAVNLVGGKGWTLLMEAAATGELEMMQWLIEEQGANINLEDQLIFVGIQGTETLAYFGAFQYIGLHADRYQYLRKIPTPLDAAIHYGQIGAIKMLIQYGASLKSEKGKAIIEQDNNLLSILQILEPHSKKTLSFLYETGNFERVSKCIHNILEQAETAPKKGHPCHFRRPQT